MKTAIAPPTVSTRFAPPLSAPGASLSPVASAPAGSTPAAVLFDLLDPVPFGLFVGALVFDVTYAKAPDVLWLKAASWMITLGLVFAIVPRLINLAQVWFPGRRRTPGGAKAAFWLNALGIVAAIVNAFVHSRDAYAIIPDAVWLSALTVALMVAGHVVLSLNRPTVVREVQA